MAHGTGRADVARSDRRADRRPRRQLGDARRQPRRSPQGRLARRATARRVESSRRSCTSADRRRDVARGRSRSAVSRPRFCSTCPDRRSRRSVSAGASSSACLAVAIVVLIRRGMLCDAVERARAHSTSSRRSAATSAGTRRSRKSTRGSGAGTTASTAQGAIACIAISQLLQKGLTYVTIMAAGYLLVARPVPRAALGRRPARLDLDDHPDGPRHQRGRQRRAVHADRRACRPRPRACTRPPREPDRLRRIGFTVLTADRVASRVRSPAPHHPRPCLTSSTGSTLRVERHRHAGGVRRRVGRVLWLVTGPMFHYSDTWQLVINTTTTIVTFLVVFMIQNTQNRDPRRST